MGLLHHLLLSFFHLMFVAMDVLVVMILVKVVYQRWKVPWLRPFANMVNPALTYIITPISRWITRITGKPPTEKATLLLLIFSLWISRLIICGLF